MMRTRIGFVLASLVLGPACSAGVEGDETGEEFLTGTGGGSAAGMAGSFSTPNASGSGSSFVPGSGGASFAPASGGASFMPTPPSSGGSSFVPVPPGTGGTPFDPTPPGAGGMPFTPTPGAGGTPDVIPPPPGGMPGVPTPTPAGAPIIPEVAGECPRFTNSTISFMGLGGIQIVAGAKPPGPTAPMVFYWHGTGSFSGEFALMAAEVQRGVVAEGGVLVSFQGTTGGDLLSGTFIFGAGDFNLTDQLLACAVRDHNIDPRRVFATGCSAGGLFSAAMAAERSNYIAAAAPNSGGWVLPVRFQNNYTPALMTMHGGPGDWVAVSFPETSAAADQAFKARGGFVINCDHGGSHCGAGSLSGSVWQFFKAHPYGVDPHPWTGGLPGGFHNSCKIY